MFSLLLVIIYIAFISLGLPDSILGSAWPSMYGALSVPMSYAGILSAIIAAGTIVSSLFSEKLIRRLGTGLVTAISVALTAIALWGFSFSSAFWMLCLFGIPYGLGAGSVDAALNNFVALHYESRHMNWLHCFWGVGATAGPSIMGLCLTHGLSWNTGYQSIGAIQIVLVVGLIFSLPLWRAKEQESGAAEASDSIERTDMLGALKLKGALPMLLAFFGYCSLEATAGLWASSYMVEYRGISADVAATMASLFYLGITVGRLLCGFISNKLGDRKMVRIGLGGIVLGVVLLLLPLGNVCLFAGLIAVGFGCAPIYPAMLHETPVNFGKANSQMLMGMQMASAYTGTTLMPLLFGAIAQNISITLYPVYLAIFAALMLVMTEKVNRMFAK